jgi:DNA modification methylase
MMEDKEQNELFAMPKDESPLGQSRDVRADIIRKYGEVLTSVWEMGYSEGKHVIELDERKQDVVAEKKHAAMSETSRYKNFKPSGKTCRGKDENSGLSTFPPFLCRRLLLYYSNPGDRILDPCAGHNSRMQITHEMDRHYTGYDVCKKFMEFNRRVVQEIDPPLLGKSPYEITLREQSSEHMEEPDESQDFVFTSPPYWSVEYYGPEKEQLGNSTYPEFLQRLGNIVKECYRVLKNGKYCAFNINDFRMNGEFYSYHADLINLFKEGGFKLWDTIIIKWQSALGACFASQVEERKITAKAHEYIIIGKKYRR